MNDEAGIIRMITAISLRTGQIIFRDDHIPIGVAARDIRKGEVINFDPIGNTGDVLVKFGITENADHADTS